MSLLAPCDMIWRKSEDRGVRIVTQTIVTRGLKWIEMWAARPHDGLIAASAPRAGDS